MLHIVQHDIALAHV